MKGRKKKVRKIKEMSKNGKVRFGSMYRNALKRLYTGIIYHQKLARSGNFTFTSWLGRSRPFRVGRTLKSRSSVHRRLIRRTKLTLRHLARRKGHGRSEKREKGDDLEGLHGDILF
jgi:hypothetical protein